jgi:hypothetical protein
MEPSGTIAFVAKKPTPEIARHAQIIKRLDDIAEQLAALKAVRGSGPVG